MTIHRFAGHSAQEGSSALDQYSPVAQKRLVKIDQVEIEELVYCLNYFPSQQVRHGMPVHADVELRG